MKKRYSRAQIDYLAAKEHFLQASKQADIRLAAMRQEGKEIGQAEMEVVIEKAGLHRAFNELVQAETTLINWTQTAIRHEKEVVDNRAAFEAMYDRAKTEPTARAIMVDLAMKLEVESL